MQPCARPSASASGRTPAARLTRSVLVVLGAAVLSAAACDSAATDAALPPGLAANTDVATMSELEPGPPRRRLIETPLEESEWTVYAGSVLYAQLNCAGCHANGGGGIGPAFIDEEWIYGAAPENVFSSIWQGRPHGMPAYGGRISREQTWQLVAFVRALAGLTPPPLHRRTWQHMEGPAVAGEPHTAAPAPPR